MELPITDPPTSGQPLYKGHWQHQGTKVCGESGDVEGATVESWKERLPEIVQGYEKDDI